jgi:hypothetical protein
VRGRRQQRTTHATTAHADHFGHSGGLQSLRNVRAFTRSVVFQRDSMTERMVADSNTARGQARPSLTDLDAEGDRDPQ